MNTNLIRETVCNTYKYAKNNDDRIADSIIKFYEEGTKSPSMATLVMRDEFKKQMRNDAEKVFDEFVSGTISKKNLKEKLDEIDFVAFQVFVNDQKPEVQPVLQRFTKAFENIYPKTHALRQELINRDRIVFESVTPKAGWFQKLKIKRFSKLY